VAEPELWVRHAEAYLEIGQTGKAAADLTRAAVLKRHDYLVFLYAAEAQLAAGDSRGYRRTCAHLLREFAATKDPEAALWCAWSCVLGVNSAADARRAVRLAQQAVGSGPRDFRALLTLGAAQFRTGDAQAAVRQLTLAASPPAGFTSPAYSPYFLAMAHYRLGHQGEARRWLKEALRITRQHLAAEPPPSWGRRLTLELLRREAEGLIRPGRHP